MKDTTIFQRLTELYFNNDFGMYYCGKRIETPNHNYGPEIRNHYLLVLVNKGTAIMCDGSERRFGEGDLLVMFPNAKIHYKALTPWSISWLGLYGKAVQEYMDLLGISPQNPLCHISLHGELKTVIDRIYEVADNRSISSKLHIEGLICEFFSILMRNSSEKNKQDPVNAALQIIDYNFCTDISLEQVAESLCVTPAYLSRRFAEQVGVSPKKYILTKRIERAKELLQLSNINIFEVSNSIGYEDQFYFCRIFKKMTGVSPSDYRKMIRQNHPAAKLG